MCCLYGLVDPRNNLSMKQKNRILSALATAAEARGTDATGIAYNSVGKMRIFKRPWPAHVMRFHVPEDARVVMGHTRMQTHGSALKNQNNHPFSGNVGGMPFALAHNGVLYNHNSLRRTQALPATKIETDSYVAVQLLQQKKALDFSSLRYMAESVEGSFVFTILDSKDNLYIVRGDNPFCLYHFPTLGVYAYASTEEILKKALSKTHLRNLLHSQVPIICGDILKINSYGEITKETFDDSKLFSFWSDPFWKPFSYHSLRSTSTMEMDYLTEVKSVAMAFGYAPEDIDNLASQGFSPEELEEFLYCGEL